jgi:hypothetical protein
MGVYVPRLRIAWRLAIEDDDKIELCGRSAR